MARAKTWVDPRGRLNVVARGTENGRELKRRQIIKGNDQTLADEVVRQLNARFAMGDLSWLKEPMRRAAEAQPKHVPVTLDEWAQQWLESNKPPVIGKRTWENYSIHVRDLTARLGSRRLTSLRTGDILELRRTLQSESARRGKKGEAKPLAAATIKDRLGVLAMIYRDARVEGLVEFSPFDTPLPRRRTKRGDDTRRVRAVQFRPFEATELEAVLEVLRDPSHEREDCFFPATEMMLLTGLRCAPAGQLCLGGGTYS